jgi:hypothetical protein
MCSILSLGIHCGIPIRVVENDRIGTRKIDTKTTTSCGENEDKKFRIVVETFHKMLTLLDFGRSVQTNVRVTVKIQKMFQNV